MDETGEDVFQPQIDTRFVTLLLHRSLSFVSIGPFNIILHDPTDRLSWHFAALVRWGTLQFDIGPLTLNCLWGR